MQEGWRVVLEGKGDKISECWMGFSIEKGVILVEGLHLPQYGY